MDTETLINYSTYLDFVEDDEKMNRQSFCFCCFGNEIT